MEEQFAHTSTEVPVSPLPGARILVVDDEEPVLELLRDILSEYPYHVDLASTGEDGLARIQSEVYDLVLTDLNLPGTDGLGVLRGAKEKDPDVAVVLLTGQRHRVQRHRGLAQGGVRLRPEAVPARGTRGLPFTRPRMAGIRPARAAGGGDPQEDRRGRPRAPENAVRDREGHHRVPPARRDAFADRRTEPRSLLGEPGDPLPPRRIRPTSSSAASTGDWIPSRGSGSNF